MKNAVDNNANAKKAPRFGVLDAVIILLVIVAIVGIYFRYNIIDLISENKKLEKYTVTFTIENIRYTTPNYVNVGDRVYFASDDELFGTLVAFSENMGALSITPASEYFTNSSGEVTEVFYPNNESRIDAIGKLLCEGRYSDEGGLLVNGSTYLSAGQTIEVNTEYVTVAMRIDNIVRGEAT